jgi:hypothetical protein
MTSLGETIDHEQARVYDAEVTSKTLPTYNRISVRLQAKLVIDSGDSVLADHLPI